LVREEDYVDCDIITGGTVPGRGLWLGLSSVHGEDPTNEKMRITLMDGINVALDDLPRRRG